MELMAENISLHSQLGITQAKMNWILSKDVNGKSGNYKQNLLEKIGMKKRISNLELNIKLLVGDEELNALRKECDMAMEAAELEEEEKIGKEFRPNGLVFVRRAFRNNTKCNIPYDIKMCLSYGWKFLFPYTVSDNNLHRLIAQIDKCVEDSIPELSRIEAFQEIAAVLRKPNLRIENDIIQWLTFTAGRTQKFFENNKHIFATRSDKGGHTVILNLSDYQKEIEKMLNDERCYTKLGQDEKRLINLVGAESGLISILEKNHKCKNLVPCYESNAKNLAAFYGLPKLNRETLTLRPIVAMNGSPGHTLGKIFNEMLKKVFEVEPHHVKDSYHMKEFLDRAIIYEDDVLVSYDVIAMYTNIPREYAKDLVLSKGDEFLKIFGIGRRILEKILKFLLVDSVVFTAFGQTYIQRMGLPMGGGISPTMARLVMDKVVEHALYSGRRISFIRVFVDDTLAAVKKGDEEEILKALNGFNENMKFTMEKENEKQSINFLNITIIREENTCKTRWYRKPFASGRLVNFYSAHKRSTVIGTAENFIRTVIKLSDPEFFQKNKEVVMDTLRYNSFPETTIINLMNKIYTYMTPGNEVTEEGLEREKLNEGNYRIFPHAICEAKKIKKILHRLKHDKVKLADSTKNTKINFVTTKKDPIPWKRRSNLILVSKCSCGQKHKAKCTEFNENGEMLKERMQTRFETCDEHRHAFRKFKVIRGLNYSSQTKFLLKYVKHKFYRSMVDNTEMPNYYLSKLIKKKYDRIKKKPLEYTE